MTVLAKIEPEWCYDNADRCAMQAKIDEENRDHLRRQQLQWLLLAQCVDYQLRIARWLIDRRG